MTDQIPADVISFAVKVWLDMQTGIKRSVLETGQCRFAFAVDCPVCGRENKLIMYLYSGGAVTVECVGVAPSCSYLVRTEISTLMQPKEGAK